MLAEQQLQRSELNVHSDIQDTESIKIFVYSMNARSEIHTLVK